MSDLTTVAELMDMYLDKWGITKMGDTKAFVEQYFEGVEQKVLRGTRLPLPLNLGYIQGLEHLYPGNNVEHLRNFGNLDYSVIWMKNPLFCYHSIKTKPELKDKIRAEKLKGVKYLDDYVEGDYYVIKESEK
jgi:hypothetical protein